MITSCRGRAGVFCGACDRETGNTLRGRWRSGGQRTVSFECDRMSLYFGTATTRVESSRVAFYILS